MAHDQVLELAGVPRAAASPRDRLHPDPAIPASHSSELVLQKAAMAGQVQMPPTTHLAIMHPQVRLPAHRAGDPPAAQPEPGEHPSGVSLTPVTLAPGSVRSLFNAVVTRTPSLL
jgi:hypothetical protein